MTGRREDLVRARRAAGLTQEELARRAGVDRSTVGRWEAGTVDPTMWARRELARVLDLTPEAVGELLGDAPGLPDAAPAPPATPAPPSAPGPTAYGGPSTATPGPHVVVPPMSAPHLPAPPVALGVPPGVLDDGVDDEIEALELARRVAASDIGEATLVRLEQAVDELAVAYLTAPPRQVLARTRRHLGYVGSLLDARKTLAEHRRLLVVGGWLSLLAGTLHVDLEQQQAATARIRTARTLADEADHPELAASTMETRAWRALTLGDFSTAVRLAQGAQQLAPPGTSAHIQATAQEGRARARLPDTRAAGAVVRRVNHLAEPLTSPDGPEHHFRYDPAKATSYTATTLTWVGDPAAADYAREVVRSLAEGPPRPRRLAVARLDLALALARRGEVDEAAGVAMAALLSGRLPGSNAWRAREVVAAIESTGAQAAGELREAYRELRAPTD